MERNTGQTKPLRDYVTIMLRCTDLWILLDADFAEPIAPPNVAEEQSQSMQTWLEITAPVEVQFQ